MIIGEAIEPVYCFGGRIGSWRYTPTFVALVIGSNFYDILIKQLCRIHGRSQNSQSIRHPRGSVYAFSER
jgi:hypothetical protein